MSWETVLESGEVRRISEDINRAKSNFKFGMSRLDAALKSPDKPWKVSELYEAVRTCCEALMFAEGFKAESHTAIFYFLRDFIKDRKIAIKFEGLRKARHRINYYADVPDEKAIPEFSRDAQLVVELVKTKFV